MDLKSDYPYWEAMNGQTYAFPQLDDDLSCDVAVVGAGITGALIADELAGYGHNVVVLDQRDVGWGSKSACTALLQYEIDTHAIDLAMSYDRATALLAYQSCLRAISEIGVVAHTLEDVNFTKVDSRYYASNRADHPRFTNECAWRKQHSVPHRWLSRADLNDKDGYTTSAATLSSVSARVDLYRLASRLLRRIQRGGTRVFDHTLVKSMTATPRSVRLTTTSGLSIRARYAVIAGGYEAQCWVRQHVTKNRSSYPYVSDFVDRGELCWLASTLLWESARPYLYLRSTGDGRLLAGDEGDDSDMPVRRDRLVDRKAAILQRKASRFLPPLHAKPAFAWTGTFAEASEGLPLFGRSQYGPRVLSAMAYGDNGTAYSMLGAGLLRAQIERRSHPLTALFSFARLGCQ